MYSLEWLHFLFHLNTDKIFVHKVMEVIIPNDDYVYVWLHDYHLMVLPTLFRKRFSKVKLWFFMHNPFPSSEICKTLLVRDLILMAYLTHTWLDFIHLIMLKILFCSSRKLILDYESNRHYIVLELYGHSVGIKILPLDIHMSQLESVLNLHDHPAFKIG